MSLARLGPRILLVVLLLLAACGSSNSNGGTVSASSYDRSCESSGDCMPIFEGHVRSCQAQLECPNAAINRLDLLPYTGKVVSLLLPCTDQRFAVCPSGGVLTCPTGQCEFHPWALEGADAGAALAVAADEYGQTCDTVTDCVPVYLGPLGCCNLGCANAAIRADAMAQYESDIAHRTPLCVPVPSCVPPDACTAGRVGCDNGRCVLLTPAQ